MTDSKPDLKPLMDAMIHSAIAPIGPGLSEAFGMIEIDPPLGTIGDIECMKGECRQVATKQCCSCGFIYCAEHTPDPQEPCPQCRPYFVGKESDMGRQARGLEPLTEEFHLRPVDSPLARSIQMQGGPFGVHGSPFDDYRA